MAILEDLATAIRHGTDLRILTEFLHGEHIDPNSDSKELIREVCNFQIICMLDNRYVDQLYSSLVLDGIRFELEISHVTNSIGQSVSQHTQPVSMKNRVDICVGVTAGRENRVELLQVGDTL